MKHANFLKKLTVTFSYQYIEDEICGNNSTMNFLTPDLDKQRSNSTR